MTWTRNRTWITAARQSIQASWIWRPLTEENADENWKSHATGRSATFWRSMRISVKVTAHQSDIEILYFCERLVDCRRITTNIIKRWNMDISELFNTLKYIRNKIDISSLRLNTENIVDIIGDVYRNRYLPECSREWHHRRRSFLSFFCFSLFSFLCDFHYLSDHILPFCQASLLPYIATLLVAQLNDVDSADHQGKFVSTRQGTLTKFNASMYWYYLEIDEMVCNTCSHHVGDLSSTATFERPIFTDRFRERRWTEMIRFDNDDETSAIGYFSFKQWSLSSITFDVSSSTLLQLVSIFRHFRNHCISSV